MVGFGGNGDGYVGRDGIVSARSDMVSAALCVRGMWSISLTGELNALIMKCLFPGHSTVVPDEWK